MHKNNTKSVLDYYNPLYHYKEHYFMVQDSFRNVTTCVSGTFPLVKTSLFLLCPPLPPFLVEMDFFRGRKKKKYYAVGLEKKSPFFSGNNTIVHIKRIIMYIFVCHCLYKVRLVRPNYAIHLLMM